MNNTALLLVLVTVTSLAVSLPWYQGAEVSPIVCSSDPVMFFNNGYPTLCAEGFTCDTAAAEAGEGNPCRAAEEEEGYE